MNTCKTCEWWGDKENHVFGQRRCNNPKLNASPDDDGVWNGWSNDPPNVFGPDFGCIHHEPKEGI